jgi:hypothetical protein
MYSPMYEPTAEREGFEPSLPHRWTTLSRTPFSLGGTPVPPEIDPPGEGPKVRRSHRLRRSSNLMILDAEAGRRWNCFCARC